MGIVVQTIGQMFRQTVNKYPQRDAIVFHGKHCTYAELDHRVKRLEKGFISLGIRRGTHIAVWVNNRPAALECYLAAWSLGAVLIPICTGCNERELNDYLRVSDAEYLIFDTGFKTTSFAPLAGAQTIVPRERVFALEDDSSGFATLEDLRIRGDALTDAVLEEQEKQVQPEDWDCFLFTSGSTGHAHAVVTTHFSRTNNAREQAEAIGATEQDRYCAALPIYHCFSLSGLILSAFSSGGCICFPEDRHIASLLTVIDQERCTVFSAVPTLFLAILARKDLNQFDLSSLRTGMIGGSTYPAELFATICERLDMTLIPSLGQTEATAGFTSGSASDSLDLRKSTVGQFFPDLEGKTVDIQTGETCPTGQVGEICVRGYNVMQGYYNQGQMSREPIDADGWLHTGDLGWLDEGGYLHYSGRIREMINRGGERISTAELENVIAGFDGVFQTKVFSVPDSHYIEEICACVIPKPGAVLDEEKLRDYCRELLAYYKVPRYFLILEKMPLLSTGKPNVGELRKQAIEKFELE